MIDPKHFAELPPCVVVDTNIWKSSLLLRSSLGPALLYALHQCGGRLGLPEVIGGEVRKQLLKTGLEAVSSIDKGFREIRAIVGSHRPYDTPTEEDVRAAIESRFVELGKIIQPLALTLDHARSALDRVNAEMPPNGPKNQQFKDSLIWEAVLELANNYRVYLVTRDSGFYRDKNLAEIAPELRQECEEKRFQVSLHAELAACLEALRAEVPEIDKRLLASAIRSAIMSALAQDGAQRSVKVGDLQSYDLRVFVTEKHDVLAVSFELVFEGIDLLLDSDNPRHDLKLAAKGDCMYSSASNDVVDPKLGSIEYSWTDMNGEHRSSKNVYARAHMFLGAGPDVRHTVRQPLSES